MGILPATARSARVIWAAAARARRGTGWRTARTRTNGALRAMTDPAHAARGLDPGRARGLDAGLAPAANAAAAGPGRGLAAADLPPRPPPPLP